jgi:hypothetical protein
LIDTPAAWLTSLIFARMNGLWAMEREPVQPCQPVPNRDVF